MRIGKVLGIPISLHFSWFIIFVLFTLMFEGHFEDREFSWSAQERWLIALATSLLMFLSVLTHELSHSIVAVRRGIPVKGITLFVLGGVSQIAREAERPSTEFVIAAVGPFTSLILGLAFFGLSIGLEGVNGHLSELTWILGWVNVMLGVFNMLPGFPLDGGRVLRAVVWKFTRNYWRATRMATLGGQALAFAMIGGGIAIGVTEGASWVQGMWLVVLGIFLYSVASGNQRQARVMKSLLGVTAADVMEPRFRREPESATLLNIMEGRGDNSDDDLVVLTRGGAARGSVTYRLIKQLPRDRWTQQSADSVMIPLEDTLIVGPDEVAYRVVELMDEGDLSQALVMDKGEALGWVTRDSLRRYEKLRNSRDSGR